MVKYYREFVNLNALSVDNIQKISDKTAQVKLHLDSITGVIDLTLAHPFRIIQPTEPSIFMKWHELNEKLSDEKISVVKVFLDPPNQYKPDEGLPWMVQIQGRENTIATIRCKDIKGLPEHSECV